MYDAYIETLKFFFDIHDEKLHNELLGAYFDYASACGEGICDFIVNVAMHPEPWGDIGRRARLNVLRHYRRRRDA